MHRHGNNIQKQQQESTFERIERMHPHKMLLYLAIIGSSLIFFFMLVAYTISKPQMVSFGSFPMPKAFVFSTIVMLLSGFVSTKVMPAFLRDDIHNLNRILLLTLLLGVIFGVSQFMGWQELRNSGVFMLGKGAGSFLYVLTGLHAAHLLGGLGFLAYLSAYTFWVARDPVRQLIMVTNPYQKIKLQIFSIYWIFLDVAWLALFFYFLFVF